MRFLAVFVILSLAGCAASADERPSTPRTPSQTVRVVDGAGNVHTIQMDATRPSAMVELPLPADQVWRALPGVYEQLGLPIESLDSRSRLVGTNTRIRSRVGGVRLSAYLDCGRTQGGPSADTYDVHLAVETRVHPDGTGKSRISTVVEATARPASFAAQTVRCSSTGNLEARIVEELAERMRGGA